MTLLFRLLDSDTISVKISRILPIVLSAVLVMSFRNNGLIVVGSCSLGLMIYFIFRGKKRKKIEVALYCVLPIVLFLILNQSLTMAFHAETFNSKEMLSIPFQQTARVIRDYKNEVSKQEWEILGAVLEDEKTLGELYDPNISDPVKRQFRSEATIGEIAAYLSLWMKWFFRHPGVYLEAFINHCYGWFDLGLRNSVRYEGRMDIFTTPYYGISNDKMLYYYYNLMNRFPITGLMENVGAYVWWLVVLSVYLFKNGNRKKSIGIFVAALCVPAGLCGIACLSFTSKVCFPDSVYTAVFNRRTDCAETERNELVLFGGTMNSVTSKREFEQADTQCVKGIAILLLLYYHLFHVKFENEAMGIRFFIPWEISEKLIGFGNICVAVFLFLSAYGMTKKLLGREQKLSEMYSYSLKRLLTIIIHFVVMFISVNARWFHFFDYGRLYGEGKQGILFMLVDALGFAQDIPMMAKKLASL